MLRIKNDGLPGWISIVILKQIHFELHSQNVGYFRIQICEAALLLAQKILEVIVEAGRNHLHVHTVVEGSTGCVPLVLGVSMVDELVDCVVIGYD